MTKSAHHFFCSKLFTIICKTTEKFVLMLKNMKIYFFTFLEGVKNYVFCKTLAGNMYEGSFLSQ